RVHTNLARQRLLDADHRLDQARLRKGIRQLNASGRQRERASATRRVRIPGLHDRFDLLMRAVELHGLLVALRVEPVEENARAAAHRRLAALERRPRKTAARAKLQAADVRLILLTQAAADRQILSRAIVILNVETRLE